MTGPDLAVVLELDEHAPHAARHHVRQVDRPSPDLRDVVVLLTSEIVTYAVERSRGRTAELRVWMPREIVRVEVWCPARTIAAQRYDRMDVGRLLLDQIADRWELSEDDGPACVWFEIDRQPVPVVMAQAS